MCHKTLSTIKNIGDRIKDWDNLLKLLCLNYMTFI